MPKTPSEKIITANRLLEGDVVYLHVAAETAQWVTDIADATLFETAELAQPALDIAKAQPDLVVGVYLMDAKQSTAGPTPVHFREDFRATGPSNYPHGKQEKADAHV